MSLSVKTLVFNAFQVNTYIIYDEDGNCMLVDPACYSSKEQAELANFIKENNLNVKYSLNTHSHVDHILGNSFIYRKYGIKPIIHKEGLPFYDDLKNHAYTFGFEVDEIVVPIDFLENEHKIKLGNEEILILYSPGHADGSICLISETGRWIISGDLLFYMSIGRTDLPTGNIEKLLNSIKNNILVYDDDYVVYPGHGSPTTVGFEKKNNPYL